MNSFIASLGGTTRIGLWQSLTSAYSAEICASVGYDWLLFDGEHAPNTIQTLLAQLQAVTSYPVVAIARVPVGEPTAIKQYLDIGFSTLLVPMVESGSQATRIVEMTRFPPHGLRGVASATSRASRFGANTEYLKQAHTGIGVIVQIESRAGLEAIEEIAAVDGVDALFIGPADLAAGLGHLGEPRHPDVQSAIADCIGRIQVCGKPWGIFALDAKDAEHRVAQGAAFVSAGTDIGLLANSAKQLRQRFS